MEAAFASISDMKDWDMKHCLLMGSKRSLTEALNQVLKQRIAIQTKGTFPHNQKRNQYLCIVIDCFSKWPEVYTIPSQETSMIAGVLVISFFCHFEVPRELYKDQGWNFKSQLMQEVLQCLGIYKTHAQLCIRSQMACRNAVLRQWSSI
jgi:hypothetical protein